MLLMKTFPCLGTDQFFYLTHRKHPIYSLVWLPFFCNRTQAPESEGRYQKQLEYWYTWCLLTQFQNTKKHWPCSCLWMVSVIRIGFIYSLPHQYKKKKITLPMFQMLLNVPYFKLHNHKYHTLSTNNYKTHNYSFL